ncbi:MAG TPA: hypothetical protein GYA07_01590 [Verrucomicrobia bacterium]|nr:hypothetical protein [Verrucomicrobiota bacterium]
MGDLLRLMLSHALPTGVVCLCLLLVTGLLLSDWAEHRRERRLLIQRARARHLDDGALSDDILAIDDRLKQELRRHQPVFRLFRWEFLVASLAVLAVVAPVDRPDVAEGAASSTVDQTQKPALSRRDIKQTGGLNAWPLALALPTSRSKPAPASLGYRLASQTQISLSATNTVPPLVSFGTLNIERGHTAALPVRSPQPASIERSTWHPE